MKIDAIYNPDVKSQNVPEGLSFILSTLSHEEKIIQLMLERNPLELREDIEEKTKKEIFLNINEDQYRLYVTLLKNEVVGICRFFHTHNLAKEKIKFPAPSGWYGMGLLVSPSWRRKGIANFMHEERLKILSKIRVTSLYSIVDKNNLASLKMHETFGFQKIAEAKGFLHLDFKESCAYLFKKNF
jgi:RimJ/RimL family protein N-acetyltransferase